MGFQVEDNICKFAKKGLTPSQIGVILRDSHGIAQVSSVTGSKILRILKAHGKLYGFYFIFSVWFLKIFVYLYGKLKRLSFFKGKNGIAVENVIIQNIRIHVERWMVC